MWRHKKDTAITMHDEASGFIENAWSAFADTSSPMDGVRTDITSVWILTWQSSQDSLLCCCIFQQEN